MPIFVFKFVWQGCPALRRNEKNLEKVMEKAAKESEWQQPVGKATAIQVAPPPLPKKPPLIHTTESVRHIIHLQL